MTLSDERNRLIVDTLAFVRRLAEAPINTVATTIPVAVAARPVGFSHYSGETDLGKAMQARFEVLRNRQRFLEIQRESHYQHAMQRIRVATEQWADH
jgi:hypothetical protein